MELKEFPLVPTALGKVVLFSVIGALSVVDPAPPVKTLVALVAVGGLGHLVEASIVRGRPYPTVGYKPAKTLCQSCVSSKHDECTNLRMLDGFEKGFKDATGYRWPVCCCGLRLGSWEEVEV